MAKPGYFRYPYHIVQDTKRGWLGKNGEWRAPGKPQDPEYRYIP